jgi:hypothetical protein
MLLLRWLKNRHYMNDNMRKYLGYAAGEIALVIVGILIALQIDAWYEDRQIRANLQTQLQSVAESISQDLAGVANLKRQRTDAIFKTNHLMDLTGLQSNVDSWYDRDYVAFVSQLIASSQVPVYLVPSTGAFRALESSGYANHIRAAGLRRNLNDYYATVERIVFTERELNNLIREVSLRYETDTTSGIYKPFLREPLLAWEPDPNTGDIDEYAMAFRGDYLDLVTDSVTQTLVRSNRNQALLKEYEHLLSLGNLLIRQIEAYARGERLPDEGEPVFSADNQSGPARVFDDGRFEAHSLGIFRAPTAAAFGQRIEDLQLEDDHLVVNYRGGDTWAFLYVAAGPIEINVEKHALDYSRFDRIRLELKRQSGCEELRLVLKDAEDPNDGTQADVLLEMSDEWATYDYPLSLFTDADLTKLDVITGFLMFGEPCSFSVRDVTYLEPDET